MPVFPAPDNSLSTLTQIQTKVRRLTRSPSTAQLTDAQLNDYINTFVLYDFPEHLRLFSLQTTLTFYTQPYIDTYSTNLTDANDPLYNFINKYITVNPPAYCAGYQMVFGQSREQFYSMYPFINSIAQIGSGDGITLNFTGTLSAVPVIANNVTFSAIATDNTGMALKDVPVPGTVTGAIIDANTGGISGAINYVTGVYSITFPQAPASGSSVNSQTVPYQQARPMALLYFQHEFIVRPIPDQPYPINVQVFKRPTELLQSDQSPELAEWWQYIAYGTAKKVFEDRMDLDSVALIMPEFKQQERLILRRTLVQQSNERTSTIYTEQTTMFGTGWGWGSGGPV